MNIELAIMERLEFAHASGREIFDIIEYASRGNLDCEGVKLLDETITALQDASLKINHLTQYLLDNVPHHSRPESRHRSNSNLRENPKESPRKEAEHHSREDLRDVLSQKRDSQNLNESQFDEENVHLTGFVDESTENSTQPDANNQNHASREGNPAFSKVSFRINDGGLIEKDVTDALVAVGVTEFEIRCFRSCGKTTKGIIVVQDRKSYVKILQERFDIKVGNRSVWIEPCRK